MKIIITLGAPLNIIDNVIEPSSHLLERLQETVRNYETNDLVIVTGGRSVGMPVSEADVMYSWLMNHNIFALKEERALTTIENALYTRKMLHELNNEVPILVITSDFHLTRATFIFLNYFSERGNIYFTSAKCNKFDILNIREPMHMLTLLKNPYFPEYEENTLIEEVKCGNISGIKQKLKEIDVKDEYGNNALHWAASYGFTDICHILFESKPSILNLTNYRGMAPLHYAIINGRIDTTWFLLSNGADLNIAGENSRWKGVCTPEQCLFQIRMNLSTEVYTPLVLMLANFSQTPRNVYIRHAESELNKALKEKKDISGIYDADLTEYGISVSEKINTIIRKYDLLKNFSIIVSPLKRTLETTKLLLNNTSYVKPVMVEEKICERLNHTSCIGQPTEILRQMYDYNFLSVPNIWWYSPEHNNINNLSVKEEDIEYFGKRINKFIKQHNSDKKMHTLIITHGGVIRFIFGTKNERNCDAFSIPNF